MARISGVELPQNKRVEIGLTYIFGIGLTKSQKILSLARVNPSIRVKDLTEDDLVKIREALEKLKIMTEGELKRVISSNIKRLIDIKSYKGSRHLKRLPVRGQRTKTNARTKRGKRLTIGGMKKVLTKT